MKLTYRPETPADRDLLAAATLAGIDYQSALSKLVGDFFAGMQLYLQAGYRAALDRAAQKEVDSSAAVDA